MRLASAQALESGRKTLDASLVGEQSAERVAGDLFALADLLKQHSALRRALSDPARTGDDKCALVRDLLADQIESVSLQTIEDLVSSRWSKENDLPASVAKLGIRALIIDAAKMDQLDRLQDELSAVRNLLRENRDLRVALSPASRYHTDQRVALVKQVFASHITSPTLKLFVHLIMHPQHSSLIAAIDQLSAEVAQYRDRSLVRVTSAQPLSDEQLHRLHCALTKKYGPVTINVSVNPEFLGGLRVRVGSDAIDGTLKADLASVKQRLGV